ncbi:MAG: SPFH domain-containing protein [Treponema sp.]|nr:SPFH domain-containing protein [Treponema sp.]
MGLFGKKTEGGLMDVIRCDEPTYLIWKWKPVAAQGSGESTVKENAIRYGSSLRVKDGEVAVFVYKQKDGTMQDYIEGPYDDTIKTANFPVLSKIVGLAFGGDSPFQAEIYFINLAGIIQTKFAVPYFDVFDPRFLDYAVPMAVRGQISFKIADYKEFIKLHRLISFDLEDFQAQIKSAVAKYVKGVVSNAPADSNIPVMQIERKILEINGLVENYIKPRLLQDFCVNVSAVDIETIDIEKTSDGYKQLKSVTQNITTQTTQAQAAVNIKQMQDMQRVQMENLSETQRIQREEMQRAQRLQTESANLSAHQIDAQTKVGVAGAEALGKMGAAGGANVNIGNGGGFNPAGMMAGMAMGGAIGQNMAGMMNGALGGLNQQVPPTPPQTNGYNVAVNGQSAGPYTVAALAQMAASGQFTKDSLVWKAGMSNWVAAGTVQELASVFNSVPPVPPPVPSN